MSEKAPAPGLPVGGLLGSEHFGTARTLAGMEIGDDDIFRLEACVRELAGEPFDNHKGDAP